MKIGIVSDVHAAPAPLAEALRLFEQQAVDQIICAGDIAGYNPDLSATIDLLIEHDVTCIIGNHDQSWLTQHPELADHRDFLFLDALPAKREFHYEGLSLYLVHAQPPEQQHGGIKLLDIDGAVIPQQVDYWCNALSDLTSDILIVGHTHQVYCQQLSDVLVINPGSSVYNHSCMTLSLPDRHVDTFNLQGYKIEKTWHWGMLVESKT